MPYGYMENDVPRMVKTPWSEEEMPFEVAAEIGTRKVIAEHSTIGILLTTDGSITEIPREDYIEAEERVVRELREIKKPFVIVLNTTNPHADSTKELAKTLEEKYQTPVIAPDCTNLNSENVNDIFGKILYEFPVERININFPGWIEGLSEEHDLKRELYSGIKEAFKDIHTVKHISQAIEKISYMEIVSKTVTHEVNLGNGAATIEVQLKEGLFYKVLTEITGVEVKNEADLFSTITSLSQTKKEYDKISIALQEVRQKGYGIVTPTMEELLLEEPEMVKQGSRFGVRLKAKAPSIHMIKADIETEVLTNKMKVTCQSAKRYVEYDVEYAIAS